MRVMVIVKASKSSEAGEMPSGELLAAMGAYNEKLVQAGVMLAGEGLHPSSKGVRVRFSGPDRTVIDGPFTETKELIAGYWLWRVNSMEEAIEWLKKCPNPMPEESEVEIRRVFEAEDFGAEFTLEMREQEASHRAVALGLGTLQFRDEPARVLAGVNGSYTMETRSGIPAQWSRFAPRMKQIPHACGDNSYGVCWNTREDCGFDYLCGVEVAAVDGLPSDLTTLQLPAGRYAVFAHSGHVSTLPAAIDAIWTKWVPDCGLQIRKAPFVECYTPEFDGRLGMGGMELWAPIENS